MGCDSQDPTTAKPRIPAYPVPVYSAQVPTNAAARDQEEQAALNRLYEITAPRHLEFLKKTLSSPDWNTQTSIVSVKGNAEAAQLLSKIYAIREARKRDEVLADRQRDASVYPAAVALLHRIRESKSAAVLTRTTRGENFVGIFDTDLTPERIAQTLRMLARSRAKHGDIPLDQVRAYVDRGVDLPHASADERAFARGVIERLSKAKPQAVPGYGEVPAVTVNVGPVDSGHRVQ
jgi:uncharacterized protein YciW